MNQFQTFSIGFGNDRGQTTAIVLQEKTRKIQLINLRTSNIQNPRIEVKKFNPIPLGPLQDCIRKKRDKNTLEQLLKVQINSDANHIQQKSQALNSQITNEMAMLGFIASQDNSSQKFIQKTKASGKQAQKYLSKYGNLEKAVSEYQKHQQLIKKVMQQYKCDRQNAIMFLQSNNYDQSLLF